MAEARAQGSQARIPAALIDLLEGGALGHLATVRADGTPHVTPLWIDHDGDTVLVNVRVDRVKAANMRERPPVAISIVDPKNPYRYLAIIGSGGFMVGAGVAGTHGQAQPAVHECRALPVVLPG
jgi:PPOX class probable F420-dependent enzyme